MDAFTDLQSMRPQLLADGYLARAVHGEHLTLAVVEIEAGAELPEHQHDNEQLGMVLEGSVSFRVGNATRQLEAGGIWRIHSSTPHAVTAGEAGAVVVDVFAPARDDWAGREQLQPRSTRWPRAERVADADAEAAES
jgi:quercetin dioxygenase-like cupin family protein